MNLLITNFCNRGCEYCFADEKLASRPKHISLDDFASALDFMDRSCEKHLSLLGGEPSSHPLFPRLLNYAILRNFILTIFTHGAWSEAILKEVAGIMRTNCTFVVNVNEPRSEKEKAFLDRQKKTLNALGENASLSFNIYRYDADFGFLIDLLDEVRCKRHIRLSLAHPIVGAANACIEPKMFKPLGKKIGSFLAAADARDVRCGLDCGFPLCMFDDMTLGRIFKACSNYKFSCGPALDVGPELDVWPCFPFSSTGVGRLSDFDTVKELHAACSSKLEGLCGDWTLYEECKGCRYRRHRQCAGGCRAHFSAAQSISPEKSGT